MLESIFDENFVNNDEELEKKNIKKQNPTIQPNEEMKQYKIEPMDKIIEEVKLDVVKTDKVKDNIFTIQIALIIAWAVLTAIVYFFGYPLFEPFINV